METDNNLAASGVEPSGSCAECGAVHARDQRYCLECGATLLPATETLATIPTSPAAGPLEPALAGPALMGAPAPPLAASAPTFVDGPPSAPPPPPSRSGSGGSAPTVIAGVGVLLLALAVGVLIGRSTVNATTANGKPQIIVNPSTTSRDEEAATTPGATTPESTAKTEKGSTIKSSKAPAKASEKAESKLGTPAKKAESESDLKRLKEKSGKENYEQKSNKLPNQLET